MCGAGSLHLRPGSCRWDYLNLNRAARQPSVEEHCSWLRCGSRGRAASFSSGDSTRVGHGKEREKGERKETLKRQTRDTHAWNRDRGRERERRRSKTSRTNTGHPQARCKMHEGRHTSPAQKGPHGAGAALRIGCIHWAFATLSTRVVKRRATLPLIGWKRTTP